ncbi:MAG TPA: DUF4062 domain-containing protein [Ktedonobacterales bacterium]|nr:DUF4062 domain-containing protein [Ktedonobacterales bacterium]
MADQLWRVFISSTTVDMGAARDKVAQAVNKTFDHKSMTMADFGASNTSPSETSVEWVNYCDIFVGLIGERLGWVPPNATRSVTEMEYDAALAAGKYMLMYVPAAAFGQLRTQSHMETLDFIDRIQNQASNAKTCCSYESPDELPYRVVIDLQNIERSGINIAPSIDMTHRGIIALSVGNFAGAYQCLSWAAGNSPYDGGPALLLGLAALGGVRPRFATLDQIQQISSILRSSAMLTPCQTVYALLYAVESDYYYNNGFRGVPEQTRIGEYYRQAFETRKTPADPYYSGLVARFQPRLYHDFMKTFPATQDGAL